MARVLSALLIPAAKSHSIRKQSRALRNWAERFSPIAAFDAPLSKEKDSLREDPRYLGINIDISGCERLFKGEKNIIKLFCEGVRTLSFHSRAAIAPTLGAAWALSRYGEKEMCIVSKDDLKKELSLLPIAALRISRKDENALQELNISHIFQLLALPRKSLALRFDKSLLRCLDRALGVEPEIISPETRDEVLKATREFSGATTMIETLRAAFRELLDELVEKLHEGSLKASHLILKAEIINASPICKEISLSLPSADKNHLWKLLAARLEQINMGCGVESVSLYLPRPEPTRPRANTHLDVASGEDEDLQLAADRECAALLDTLGAELGRENIFQLHCRESHLPEKAFNFRPFIPENRIVPSLSVVQTERPSLLFYRPRAIQAIALLPDSPPARLNWQGENHLVVCGSGPERIAPEWWGPDASLCATRDYFKVQSRRNDEVCAG